MKDIIKEIPNKIEYEKYVLNNGLTVVLVPDKKLLTVLVDLYVKVGSQYEPDNIAGISHFLEHMSFKGTTNHPTNLDLILPLDSVGSSYNAGTGFDMTDYYVKCGHQFIERAVNFISDIFQNSIFPKVEFEREKGVVIEEIRMYEDMPQYKVEDVFFKLMYGKQGAGRSIAGDEKTVKHTTRKDMLNYYHKYYGAKNAYLFIGGNFDKKEAKKLINKYFKSTKTSKKFLYPKTEINQKSPRISLFKKDTKETHFILGFHSFPLFDDKNYTLNIIDEVLSGGFASRL
jgi:predicted Zn-dependent peptidase